jgi:hypothetical protein
LGGIPAKVRYRTKNTPFEKNNQPIITGILKNPFWGSGGQQGVQADGVNDPLRMPLRTLTEHQDGRQEGTAVSIHGGQSLRHSGKGNDLHVGVEIFEGSASGNEGPLPLFRFDIPEEPPILYVDLIGLGKLMHRPERSLIVPENTHFHVGGSDIDSQNGQGSSLCACWVFDFPS